jgi:AraC-like DNA-binding protein
LTGSENWARVPISSVEDLSNAVYGAGLDVTQMSRAPVTGNLAFAFNDGITYGTGLVGGQVAIAGPLSLNMVTLGLGLILTPGSRQWLNEVATGNVGIFLPGDAHDALYMPGSMYATVTVSSERLEEMAAKLDMVLDGKTLGGSGVDPEKLPASTMARLSAGFLKIHVEDGSMPPVLCDELLAALIVHLGRIPRPLIGRANPKGYALIVMRARTFIHEHLDQPLSIDKIAEAARTSHRTLHRAFHLVLNETPYSYVLKLRLHRIRHELISDRELSCSITTIANHWCMSELGKFAGWYNDLFGELPSKTAARCRELVTPPIINLAGSA